MHFFEQHFASIAIGIWDFYHAAQQLWEVAEAHGDTLTTRTLGQWFERLRYLLRHGYVHRIFQELGRLLKYPSTLTSAKPVLKRMQQYLSKHPPICNIDSSRNKNFLLVQAWSRVLASG